MKKIALIPAYQPTGTMLTLLQDMQGHGFEMVLVDDGSAPKSAPLFLQASRYATVLHHSKNRGKGRALKTGLSYIQKNFSPDYLVVTLDADGQHKASDAVRICRAASRHPNCLILGSRRLTEGVPLRSRMGNSITRLAYQLSTGLRVYDTQTGLRAFHSRLLSVFLEIPGERYEYEMNVLLVCPRRGIPIRETKIQTIYFDNNAGSHFNTVKDSCRIVRELLRFSASSLVCFLADYSLFSFLSFATAGLGSVQSLVISNAGARICSASLNFALNRKLVFHSDAGIKSSMVQYFLLASAILAGNTLLLSLLADGLGMELHVAKLCAEAVFFTISWLTQRLLIFPSQGGD